MGTIESTKYLGMCDVSAATKLADGPLFIAASDEENTLRVFDHTHPGPPLASFDLSGFLNRSGVTKEADIEGAAAIGTRVYWIGSHGRDKSGEEQEARHRLFATTITVEGNSVQCIPAGKPYKRLLKDLASARALRDFGLEEAATLPPQDEGGLNIEGLAATPEGHLLVGFRNPIPKHKALIVRIENPAGLIEERDSAAKLSVGGLLDLDRLGIRALEYSPRLRAYVVIAGRFDKKADYKLYSWSGDPSGKAKELETPALSGLQPEELIIFGWSEGETIELFSDDGDLEIDGVECKKRPDTSQRSFRSLRFSIAVT